MTTKHSHAAHVPTKAERDAEADLATDEIDATIAYGFATEPDQRDTTDDK